MDIPDYFSPLEILITFNQISVGSLIEIFFFILLIISSALISGSEIAFFSFSPAIIEEFKSSKNKKAAQILKLLEKPDILLATILIANNFINIAIVILSTYITSSLIDFHNDLVVEFITQAVIVTFIILLFGEIIPKIYANKMNKKFALLMAYPLLIIEKSIFPFSALLAKSSKLIDKKHQKTDEISMTDISYAIDITKGQTVSEKKIIKSVINLSNFEVREIMTPRVDVVTVNFYDKLSVIKKTIAENEFSRYPVIKDSQDDIAGILFIKDLLKIIEKDNDFEWQKIIKPAYFVPENKKTDDLLQEFREKKIHLAIVSDEYGGFSGIITLEDIIEEIVGDITDEYDTNEELIKKIDDSTYLLEGKLLLKDFQKYMNLPVNFFDDIKTDIETIAGLILEILGEFPKINQKLKYKDFEFTIKETTKTRIVKVMATLNKK